MSLKNILFENKSTVKTSSDQDGLISLSLSINNKEIGVAHLEEFYDYNWDLEDVIDEEEFDKYFDDYNYISLRHIEIDDKYKGQGYGKKLMVEVINWCKENGYKQLYLNASPMGFSGLSHHKLVNFYKSLGFKTIKDQGKNTIMILDL